MLVGILLSEHPRSKLAEKTRAALELIRKFEPRQYDRLRRLVDGIFVFDETGPLGEWMRAPKLIRLNEAFIASPDTTNSHVAGTIVHETTHAWLENHGFEYRADRRRRIEAICYRAEAAFARRLPNEAALASEYEERAVYILTQTDADWSDAAFLAKDSARLRSMDFPEWLVRWFVRRKSRRVA